MLRFVEQGSGMHIAVEHEYDGVLIPCTLAICLLYL